MQTASRLRRGGLLIACLLLCGWVGAQSSIDPLAADRLLKQADAIRTSDHARFVQIVRELQASAPALRESQRQYLRYLQGWKHAYDGNYRSAIPLLQGVMNESTDPTLRFRAGTSVVNVLALATRYREAFTRLSEMLELLPQVTDGVAREQGLGVAAYLYNQVGEYELGMRYAEMLIQEDWEGRGACNGGQLRLEALYKSGKVSGLLPELHAGIRACERLDEPAYANQIRTYVAQLYIDHQRYAEAIKFLTDHYDEVSRTRYPHLIAEFDALLATAYRRSGDAERAQKFATNALSDGVQDQYTAPRVMALRLLYELAEERGDYKLALDYQKRFTQADRAYLDDVSARQIAYEKVKHELMANQLQIEALNRQNQILQLEKENNRLYFALLMLILAFIALWAYKTKRSQVHFMKLSQRDGLTGIANRTHFIERAERVLAANARPANEVCVALFDLDHFKSINDRFGHAAGDFVLKQTAAVCQSLLRPQDLFGRVGGEEFGILLAKCELAVARQRCEQLRAAIASIPVGEVGIDRNVTASFGLASTRTSGYDLRALLKHADAALYDAKSAGRNCCATYDPQRIPPSTEPSEAEERAREADDAAPSPSILRST